LSHFDVRSSAIFAEPRARHASAIAGGFARTTDRAPRCCCGSISSLWFSNLHFAPCVLGRVRHAPLRPSRFTPVRPSHASRSLFGATFRYPCFVEPYHNRAAHPHCICRADRAATLMGFSHPSQCSPSAGPGVCDVTLAVCARPSPPFIPTCRYRIHIAPFVFTAVRRARLSEFAKQTPSTRASKAKSRARQTAMRLNRLLGVAAADEPSRAVSSIAPGQSCHGLWLLLSGLSGAFSQHVAARAANSRSSRVVWLTRARSTACRSFFPMLPSAHGLYVRLRERMCSKTDGTQHGPGLIWFLGPPGCLAG
jgi:hypothetical protein